MALASEGFLFWLLFLMPAASEPTINIEMLNGVTWVIWATSRRYVSNTTWLTCVPNWATFRLDSKGYCKFPEFVWSPFPDGNRRTWITETMYISHPEFWDKQKEITTRETEMIVRLRQVTSCRGGSAEKELCYRQETLYRVICIAHEPDEKYRVQLRGDNSTEFTCMRFVHQSPSFLQIYIADPKEINEDRLCYDAALERHPWPWIAPMPDTWHPCPFVGGFDFRIYEGTNHEMCPKIWRPSRLESDCIYGEGMAFHFPDTGCSPFIDHRLERHVQCWTNWTEGEYHYIMLAEAGKQPQYMLRIPVLFGNEPASVDIPLEDTADGASHPIHIDLFLNPVAPLTKGDLHKYEHLRHYQLHMARSESGVCYDESERCKAFAKKGKCINRALHKYANFCKHSCGRCDIAPSTRQECVFPLPFQGEWMLFDGSNNDTVTITPGEIYFSHLGNFICKSTHWERNHFKLLTVVHNGCRPRYACIHFSQLTEHSLQFRISRSTLHDSSFDQMCQFNDDPLPLGGRIRSVAMKTMIASAGIVWNSCGLGGELRVNASQVGGHSCFGTLTDWDTHTCTPLHTLTLTINSCQGYPPEVFECIGYMSLADERRVLITRRTGDPRFSCWDISTKLDTVHMYPDSWSEAYQRRAGVCGTQNLGHVATSRDFNLHVQPYEDRVRQNCQNSHGSHVPERSTRAPLIRTTTQPLMLRTPKISKVTQTGSIQESSRARERKSNSTSGAHAFGDALAPTCALLLSLILCIDR